MPLGRKMGVGNAGDPALQALHSAVVGDKGAGQDPAPPEAHLGRAHSPVGKGLGCTAERKRRTVP